MTSAPYVIEKPTSRDRPFIMSSWDQSYRRSPICRDLDGAARRLMHGSLRDALYDSPTASTAVLRGETGLVLGWTCWSDGILHYIYVIREMRSHGMASRLLAHAGLRRGFWATHWLTGGGWCEYMQRTHGMRRGELWAALAVAGRKTL